jgi:hypothetical protein
MATIRMKNSTGICCSRAPHGIPSILKEYINADFPAFLQRAKQASA